MKSLVVIQSGVVKCVLQVSDAVAKDIRIVRDKVRTATLGMGLDVQVGEVLEGEAPTVGEAVSHIVKVFE